MKLTPLITILLLINIATCRRMKEKLNQQIQTKEEKKTVVEANHFYSNQQTNTNYEVNNVQKDKPLILYLKPQNGQENDKNLEDNPISITIQAGTDTANCTFTSYSNLCSLPKITVSDVKLKLACKKLPCELSWDILQPPTHQQEGDHDLDQLVAVNQQSQHAVVKVVCNNPDLRKTFGSHIKLYSNSIFRKFVTDEGMVYFLFSNEQKGYYFLTSDDDQASNCANATVTQVIETVDFNPKTTITDFTSPLQTNAYQFSKIPGSDFRVQFSAHDAFNNELTNNTGMRVGLIGYKSAERKQLSVLQLTVDDEKTYIEFSLVFKKPTESYDRMELQLKGFGTLIVVQMRFYIGDLQDVQMGEESFFDLKKGEKISYQLVPLPKDTKGIDKINIFTSDSKLFTTNVSSCSSTGCNFTLEALDSGQGNIYIGESATRKPTEIIIEEFTRSVTKTIREGEQNYFSYKMKAKQALQLLINSPSVMAFAAAKTKCDKVDDEKDCIQKAFNSHNPAIYEPDVDDTLLIKVVALDNCEFSLTVLDSHTQFIEIKDAVPFTYLMDDKENFLFFTFRLDNKQDVSFNLIAPVNELVLNVVNKQKVTKQDQDSAEVSSDGYIKFAKADINDLVFQIKVEKRAEYRNKYVHFTLIASTKEANLRLQPGVAHYQTLQPKDSRDYVFQFQPKKAIMLNFYTHNIKENVNISLKISNADEYSKEENTADMTIDQEVDVLDIALISKRLCKQAQGENCELFVRLQNRMDVETDITVTLMIKDAIIELKDGIWQNYATTLTSASSHFYFLPKHQNHSTTVFYKSSLVDLKIMYSLWQSDDQSIDTSQWPFPDEYKENQKLSELTFKPIDFIHIGTEQLKTCWPNCVVLMSIVPDIKAFKNSLSSLSKETLNSLKTSGFVNAQFKIMASNNYIELPQKHKVDVVLVKNEQKELLVDLKYYLQKQALTFSTYTTLGSSVITANLYSQSNPRCPNGEDAADFTFNSSVQNEITIEDIKSKMADNSMQNDRNVYLCMLVQAKTDTKFSIDFTSDADSIKALSLDSSYKLRLSPGQSSSYQIDSTQQFQLKITRNEGYPYMYNKLCKPGKDMDKCIQQFKDSTEAGTQLADKVSDVNGQPCPQCILFVRISSKQQPSEVLLHVQSRYTQVELAQNTVMADDIQPNQQNRYTLTGTKDEQIIINIQINNGNLKVQVHDFDQIDITKTNTPGSTNIHITIPSKDLNTKGKALGTSQMSSFGLSNFVHLHITVESQDSKQKALYTITYSSGSPTVYLQDGLITEYNLISKRPTKFVYKNPSNAGIYVHISTTDTQSLNKLALKMFAMDNPEDEDSTVELIPQKPNFKKKTPNPTMLMQLPAKHMYLIQVTNNNDKDTLFTIGINNRQIIYLPFDHEFPVQLTPKDHIYVVVSTVASGYVKISFSKCDESEPYIGYTLDYNEFIEEDYSTEEQMSDQLMQQLVIKVKEPGGIYLKIRSPDDDSSLMTIKATFSTSKITLGRAKAGDKGVMQYQLLDSTQAQLTFTSLVCGSDKNCNKDFAYSALSSDKIQNVYAQLVCPSIVFDLQDVQQMKSADLTPITSNSKNNKMSFTQPIKGDIEYIGVKAFNAKTGDVVYYRPVEIVTFWGELHRTSKATLFLGAVLIFAFLLGVLLIYRRWKKQEYRPLGDELNE